MTENIRCLPAVVAHADWSIHAPKRWVAIAHREGTDFRAEAPRLVGNPGTLLRALAADAVERGPVLAGFDFPIGLPSAYAAKANIARFTEALPGFGDGEWEHFYERAAAPGEISLRRPFYPHRGGGTCWPQLWRGLGLSSAEELLRRCDRKTETRRAACAMFWTLGGNQVGCAAISGWRDVLAPALADPAVGARIWPFDGALGELLATGRVVVAETYPTEFYGHLDVRFRRGGGQAGGKGVQANRRANAPVLQAAALRLGVRLTPELEGALRDGFGDARNADDPFDAFVGVLGMLNVIRGYRPAGDPDDPAVRNVEGWILAQQA